MKSDKYNTRKLSFFRFKVRFFLKAEDVLPGLLRRFTNERVVAIVDPPRAGLRKHDKSLTKCNQ